MYPASRVPCVFLDQLPALWQAQRAAGEAMPSLEAYGA